MTQISRQVLYGSGNTPFNASDSSKPRPFAYWADLGFSDMLMWTNLPGSNGGPPAVWAPLGGANNGDYKFVVNQAKTAGMNLILSTKMHGYYGVTVPTHAAPFNPPYGSTVQRDWLTDTAHQANLLTSAHTMARWAQENGYLGVFYDEEISSSNDGWTYAGYKLMFPTSTLTQAQAEQAAYNFGRAWMGAHVVEFPGLEYHNYSASYWPSGWSNFWRTNYTNSPISGPSLQNFFYKGVLSALGYGHVYFWNADFYGGEYGPATANNTYTYAGKTYDRWQWGSVQFDRDQVKAYWSTFLDAGTDLTKVDIVPFIAVAQIENGQSQAYATKPLSTVSGQIAPSINQKPSGNNSGLPWRAEPTKPVQLFGHYAYGSQAETFDYAPYRDVLRLTVQATTTTVVPVTLSDGVSSSVVNITIN